MEEDKKKTRSQLLKEYLRHVLKNVVCYPDPISGFQKYGLLNQREQKLLDKERKEKDLIQKELEGDCLDVS